MPLYTHECANGHSRDVYIPTYEQRGTSVITCLVCQERMVPVFSPGTTLTYFAEGGGGKWIHNLGPEPVLVTSHKHHRDLMKAAGVEWSPNRRGMKGCWGG